MELFKLFGTIAVNNSEANQSIDDTTDKAEKSESKMGSAFEKVGSAAKTVGKVVATGMAAAGAGIVAMTKSAVQSYADYEQLVGGVETLFKESSDKVLEYSKNAYKNAGLSANEYMETITGFSASLIQSLDGDTEKAAEVGNRAIEDMSDNANKMGTSMESIQNAYQGFAKQNYTMLDNLKLGYGGTKEEMARLIEDASQMTEEMDALGISVDSTDMSFGNIVNAISVVQKHLDITGTTSKEAASTISGSIGMMKSAWTNFLTGMADPEQDFGQLLDNLVESVVTVANNLAPRLLETIPRLVEGLVTLVENLIPYIPPILEQLIPVLIEGAANIVMYLIQNLPSILMSLGTALWDGIKSILFNIGEQLPAETTNAFSYMKQAFEGIWTYCQTAWETIGKPVFDMIVNLVGIVKDWFNTNFGDIETIVSNAFTGIESFWNEHLKPCFEAIGNFISEVLAPTFEQIFMNFILPVFSDFITTVQSFWENSLKPIFTGIIDFLTGVFSGDWEKAFSGFMDVARGLLNGIEAIFKEPFEIAKSIVLNAIETIKEAFDFTWELPQLKLPHFSVSPAGWQLGDLLDGTIPSLGIEWYAKAMDEPYVFAKPTVVGNKGFGDAGDEMVYGRQNLMEDIREAAQPDTTVIQDKMNKIIELLERLLGMNIILDSGALVGELAPAFDTALGSIYEAKGRGERSVW